MKRLHTKSQNFLRSPKLVYTLIGHSNIKKSDTVYDIGAGSGIIAGALAKRCKQVVAIEHDARLIATLQGNLGRYDNVTILRDDVLHYHFPATPYKIFANIPFHLSSPVVRKLTESEHPPRAIYLIVQKQFAQKLLMDTSSFTGSIGALITPLFTTRIRYKLQRSDFTPPPAVDTVLIELKLRAEPLLDPDRMSAYREFVELCFARQKYFTGLGQTKRPSELTSEEWVELFRKVAS
ncbi:MAG: rRNA adenine N-6-methyltransferase family protein [Candidatus Saccharimonadales bacterium]